MFTPLNAAMLPLPEAGQSRSSASLFVHAYVVPATGLVKFTAVVVAPLHTVWSLTLSTEGVGFTVISKLSLGPRHPLAVGRHRYGSRYGA